jgi:ATP-dependent Clp protease protease subunit
MKTHRPVEVFSLSKWGVLPHTGNFYWQNQPPLARYATMPMTHPHSPSPAALPRFDDDDDDDEKKENDQARKNAAPVAMQIQKKFLEQRKIFLWGAVTDESAKDLTEKLLYLETIDPGREITFYINSPGGSVTAGMAVYDTMKLITSPINVVVTGMAASMGSILLSGAPKGRRYIYPHARVLIHQPLISGRMVGPATDINIQAKEMEKIRAEMNKILADASGQPIERINHDTDRDFYLNAQEAIAYGLADKIVDKI